MVRFVKKWTNQEQVKHVGLGHVAAARQNQDGETIADETRDPDGQDRDAFEPEAADGDGGLVVLTPGAAIRSVSAVKFWQGKIALVWMLVEN